MAKVSLKYIRVILASILIIVFSLKIVAVVQAKYKVKSSVSIEKDADGEEKKECDGGENLKAKLLGEDLFFHDYFHSISLNIVELSLFFRNYLHEFFLDNYMTVLTPPPDCA